MARGSVVLKTIASTRKLFNNSSDYALLESPDELVSSVETGIDSLRLQRQERRKLECSIPAVSRLLVQASAACSMEVQFKAR